MRIRFHLLCFLLTANQLLHGATPKLVVVISLDQFPYEYLTRFEKYYGAEGFNYLIENGANFSNAVNKHANNSTGPGHAAMLTGTYANLNGIIANSWYDRVSRASVNCVEDKSVSIVGAAGDGRSPANLLVPTFGDELRLHYGFKSKVISVSNKDRAAILMGGRMANGAFWLIDSSFITSTYYRNELPEWVKKFNESGLANSYFGKAWNRTLKEDAYSMLDKDDVPYESNWSTIGKAFPHLVQGTDATRITRSYYNAMNASPFGLELLAAFAHAAIDGEELGEGPVPDLLCVGFSSTDEVGHAFGPHSREVLEMCIQTDRVLADFLRHLDMRFGLKHVVVVLTSDHGITPIPEYVKSQYPRQEAGRLTHGRLETFSDSSLTKMFGEPGKGNKWTLSSVTNNLYLNRNVLQAKKLDPEKVFGALADALLNLPGIAGAYPRQTLMSGAALAPLEAKLRRSFHPKRSGDVLFAMKPYFYLEDHTEGAEHGNPYDHDGHVPLIIMGNGIRSGTYAMEASIVDIGPTLSSLLGVEFPAAREGRVLVEALKLP